MRRTARSLFFVLLAASFLLVSVTALGADHAYIGSAKCKMCHLKEFKSWSQTKMATAFEALKPGERAEQKKAAGLDPSKDYTADEDCVRCHVTGYGKPGGFTSAEATPGLAGIGCEVCHGPGGTYTQKEHMSLQNKEYKKSDLVAVGMVDTVSEQQCLGCHNNESPFVGPDFVFDFEAKKNEGTHEKFPLKYEH
jgi:hypothetical protein